MAWVFDYAVTELTTAGTAFTADMPEHQANDMLIVFAAKDTTGALTQTTSGYTALSSGAGGAQWVGAWYRRAATSAEPAPAFTLAVDEANCVVVCVRGAHTSTNPTSVIATDDATQSGGGYLQDQTYLTPSTNSIVLFGGGTDSGMALTPMPGFGQVLYAGDAGTAGVGVWWQFFKSASVDVDNYQCFGNVADNCRIITVGVPDDGNNTYEPGRVDQTSTDQTIYAANFTGATIVAPDSTWTAAASNSITMLGNDWDKVWTFNGGATWTDETTDLNDDGAGDIPLGNTVADAVYFGSNTTFNSLAIDVGTAGTGSPVGVWEYWNGAWTTLSFNTYVGVASWNSNFTVAGSGVIRFPIPSDWVLTQVNTDGSPGFYYVRRRVSTAWTAAPTLDQSLKDGRPLTFDASSSVADSGVNPYAGSAGVTPATTAAVPANVGGGEYVRTGTVDWSTTTRYLLTSVAYTAARDIVDIGFFDLHKGLTLTLMDANAENRRTSWMISAKDATDARGDKRSIVGIQPAQTTNTALWRHGNLDEAAIDTVLLAAGAPFGALSVSCSILMLVGEHILAGGTAASPLTFIQFINALKHGSQEFPVLDPQGNLADVWYPIKFGGGDDVHVVCDLNIFQFPTRASATDLTTRWHVDDDKVGFDFNGQTGDTIKFTNCLFTGGTPYYFRFNASASSGCTWDFVGCTIVGATVTLRSVYTFTTLIFNNCSEITLNGADIIDSTIRDTRATTSQGAIAFTSAAEADGIDRITFINNHDGDIGHSIRITATGTYTFDGHQFSGGGPAERSFNTTTGVVEATDIVTVDAAHGYADGDAIYYQDQGGAQNMGLTDGTLYYVNSQTSTSLSFHSTKAAAIADTGRVALTSAGGETHYIYSAKADVYNNSGGAVTINLSNGADTPTIRESNGSSTTINNLVTLSITVADRSGTAVSGAQVWIQKLTTDADTGHPGNPFTSATGNNQGDADFVVNQTPPTDLPASGWLRTQAGGEEQTYRYASRSGSTFSLNTEVTGTDGGTGTATTIVESGITAKNIIEGDTIRNTTQNPDQWAIVLSNTGDVVTTTALSGGATWTSAAYSVHRLAVNYASGTDTASVPLMNEQTDGSGLATESYNYLANKAILVRIRSASGSTEYLPFSTTGTITSSGYSLSATIDEDTIKT